MRGHIGGEVVAMQWRFGRHEFTWRTTPRTLMDSAGAPLLMGVLNVTPDSFSDGGRFDRVEQAVTHGLAMVRAGARIIDIGGESSRPGAEPVPADVEASRVLPVIEGLRAHSAVCISIDTAKAPVARAALAAGADVINDITAMTGDEEMPALAAETGAGVVLMHMRGCPRTMQSGDLSSPDIVSDVADYLAERVHAVCAAGVERRAVCIDPGIGFGKTVEQNLALVAGLGRFVASGQPVLLGVSRKSFIGALTDRSVDQRLAGTAAACAIGVWMGAHILRVHDVAEMGDVAKVSAALRAAAGHAARSEQGRVR